MEGKEIARFTQRGVYDESTSGNRGCRRFRRNVVSST